MVEEILDPTELMKKLYGDAIAEFGDSPSPEDFGIILNSALRDKYRRYQREFNFAMARIFCDAEIRIPKPLKVAERAIKEPKSEIDREVARHAAKMRRLALGRTAMAIAEERALIKLSTEMTQHDAWKLGGTLREKYGKKNGRALLRDLFTPAQLKKDGFDV